MNEKNFVSIRDAAKLSGLSVHFWRKAIAEGRVYFIRSGTKFYVDFDRSIERLRSEANSIA
jgi:hypothetical protein